MLNFEYYDQKLMPLPSIHQRIPSSCPADLTISTRPIKPTSYPLLFCLPKCTIPVACKALIILLAFTASSSHLYGQKRASRDTSAIQTTDILDVARQLFKIKADTTSDAISKPSISLLPVIGYNPSFGGVLGINMVAGRQNGDPANTGYSVYALGVTYGTKGILTFQARHNIFKPENKWNFQGNWQFSKYGLLDHGLGTGNKGFCSAEFAVGDYPTTVADSAYPIKYNYVRLYEKIYRKIGAHTFAGVGLSLNIFDKINDVKLSDSTFTPHQRYSLKHGFDPGKYSANGLIFAFQFNNREHPIRSYGGIYFDINLQIDHKWMGSTTNSLQLFYDFRKYWSLSKRNPEHVLAVWHWASYLLSGELPYLEMPYTGSDTYNRSGRAYTIGYFRGPSYAYFETEYRYPITRNKLISGVVFMNFQTASDDFNQKIYQGWNVGAGAGLRILFQENSRSAVCVDFSTGECGASGIFFGLNEVF